MIGEANTLYNKDLYDCTFKAMIDDWRMRWSHMSSANPEFPFGFVQLGTNVNNGVELLRWYQTYNWGFAPNPDLNQVFMAVAIDTNDPVGGIHPRYKQIVGERLAIAGSNVAYGLSNMPTNGPFPTSVVRQPDDSVIVTMDMEFTHKEMSNGFSGYSVCCNVAFESCLGSWTRLSTDLTTVNMADRTVAVNLAGQCSQQITGLAYLWEDTPIEDYLGAPIYAADQYR